MKGNERYIEDERFLKWVFQPDEESEAYYAQYFKKYPKEKAEMIRLKEDLKLLSFTDKSYPDTTSEKIYRKILVDIITLEKREKWRNRFVATVKYAAIAFVLVASGFLVYLSGFANKGHYKFSEELLLIGTMVEPRLYLADGSSVTLSGPDYFVDYSLENRLVIGKDTIACNVTAKRKNLHNLLVVAYGKRVKVRLPDKSEVWVNAGSRLITPQQFSAKKREVFLFGEGFFDVEHNEDKPFYVQTTAMAVKVLGTEFNVSAYPENNTIETVLKEGSVQIESTGNTWFAEKAIIKPNQKATFEKSSELIKIEQVEHENYTRWKEGLISIDDDSLKGVMATLERYFNIDIEIVDPKNEKVQISGKLDFSAGMDRVFKYIEKLTNGKFEENGPGKYRFK
ncbi:FecR domain-containing protein [uncultured Draconibacterium sp.]|uniref:FecR family protein n=1 Tax=uncultured Draconibacterium sp. TaxID=1573823 RepID=UPI0025FEB018|nr:FecR domain-containing protein [uncultured Draconibacterium sp.]